MTTNEIPILIKNAKDEIYKNHREIEVFNITLNAMQSNDLDTREVSKLIENKTKQINELNKNINAYSITIKTSENMKNIKEENFSDIEEINLGLAMH